MTVDESPREENEDPRRGWTIVKSMGYFYMKSLNWVYDETKCLTTRVLPLCRLITPHR